MITTVIPTYKRPHLLRAAIQSALNQTFRDIEVVIFDDASNDETENVVKEIARRDLRVKYICHPKNIKAPENFQLAIASVKTPFFSILADDDLLAPRFYETARKQIGSAAFFLGSTLDVNAKGSVISADALKWDEKIFYEPPSAASLVAKHYFNWTGALFRTEIAQNILLDKEVKPIDFDFILRLTLQYSCVVSKKPCALFIHHSTSYSSAIGLKLVWPSWQKIIQNVEAASLSSLQKIHLKTLLQSKLYHHLFSIAVALIASEKFEQAENTLKVLISEFPESKKGKLLNAMLPHLKARSCHFAFKTALALYQFRKRIKLQIRYGRFVKKLKFPK